MDQLCNDADVVNVTHHTNHGNEIMLLSVNEVIERLTEDGISCYPTMLGGDWNQIVATDNPKVEYSTWFDVADGMVEVDEDFTENYPLSNQVPE